MFIGVTGTFSWCALNICQRIKAGANYDCSKYNFQWGEMVGDGKYYYSNCAVSMPIFAQPFGPGTLSHLNILYDGLSSLSFMEGKKLSPTHKLSMTLGTPAPLPPPTSTRPLSTSWKTWLFVPCLCGWVVMEQGFKTEMQQCMHDTQFACI